MNMRKVLIAALIASFAASCGTSRSAAVAVSGGDELAVRGSQERSEIVSDGYQRIDSRKNASSINRVDIKDEELGSYNTIFEYLRGRVPGVQIGYAGPGGTPSVTIRGENSFNAGTQPLFVVDGAVVSDIASINPNDVASVNVLKDSSTSIYGSRGAGGVIVIKTKSAQEAAARAVAEKKAAKAARRSGK